MILLAAALAGASLAFAQATSRMEAPLIPVAYNPQLIHFEEMPAELRERCPDVVDRPAWIYAAFALDETKYYIISGWLVDEPDPTGAVIAIHAGKCKAEAADKVMSGELPPGAGAADLSDAFSGILPGDGARQTCTPLGSCTYQITSRKELLIINGLLADLLHRFAQAFGRKEAFLAAAQRTVKYPELMLPTVRRALEQYRSQKEP